jgi:hypothetical protein
VLEGQEWRRLIDAILTGTTRDLRDRAIGPSALMKPVIFPPGQGRPATKP